MSEKDIPRFKLAKEKEAEITSKLFQLGSKIIPKYWVICNHFYDDIKEED